MKKQTKSKRLFVLDNNDLSSEIIYDKNKIKHLLLSMETFFNDMKVCKR